MNDSTPAPDYRKPSRRFIAFCVILAGALAVGIGFTVLLLFFQARQREPEARSDLVDSSLFQHGPDSLSTEKPAQVTPLPPEIRDYSSTNAVSILMGQEGEDDGLKHLFNEPDGRTTIETLDGVPCRHHNRKPDNKRAGYLYFAIHPDFKHDEVKLASIEIEYRVPSTTYIRLQYDGMEGETHKRHKPVLPMGGEVTPGTGVQYSPIQASDQWQTATFQVTNGVFMNSQNGGADFRLELFPPEIYVRRVSVTRRAVQPPPPLSNQ